MKKTTVDAAGSLRPVLFILFLALFGAQAAGAGARAGAQTAPARQTQIDITAEARSALDRIGPRDFRKVRDGRLRAAGAHALDALKKLARNTSEAREAALLAEFNRSVDALKAAQPKPSTFETCDRGYETCMELCKETGGNCQLCAGVNNLCYMMNLTIELVEENDPKNAP